MTGLRILVVDDDVDLADSLADLLDTRGHQVTTVHSGEAAVDVFDPAKFDLVFMDVKLPGMNGVESFLEIKKQDADARVVMMTAFRLGDLLATAVKGGALAVLEKPFDFDRVISLLSQVGAAGVVLVADDDTEFTTAIEEVLAARGFRVVIARTGAEAVALALAERVDFLMLDLRLPDLAGSDVYQEISRMPDPPETVVVTGYAQEECAQIVRLRGMDVESCLTKPVDPKRLVELIERTLSRRPRLRMTGAFQE